MSIFLRFLFLFSLSLFPFLLKAQKLLKMGHMHEATYYKDTITGIYKIFVYETPNNIWFKDSLVIMESRFANTDEDEEGNIRKYDSINKYIFLDLRSMTFYEYKTFTDTAEVLDSYDLSNENEHADFFRFYLEHLGYNAETVIPSIGEFLADTIIDGINYARYRFQVPKQILPEQFHEGSFTTTLYFNCESNEIFGFFKQLKMRPKCPITRYEDDYNGYKLLHEIKIVGNSLTPEQIKVFNTWELYAKTHPIKQ